MAAAASTRQGYFNLAPCLKLRTSLNKGQQAMAMAFAYPEPDKGGRGRKMKGET
jgi:hypothetical protein